jgi:hypothetical protein
MIAVVTVIATYAVCIDINPFHGSIHWAAAVSAGASRMAAKRRAAHNR